jgi:diguanylate cyclase (GGDEF)-like protein
MPLKHLKNVYSIHPGKDGRVTRHLTGRFLTAGKHLHVLEDNEGFLSHLQEGPLTQDSFEQIHDLHNSSYLDVVNQEDLEQGKRPDLLPEVDLEKMPPKPPSSFTYHHNGADQPDHIDFVDGVPHHNGTPTTHMHIRAILDNVRDGVGVVRYKKDQGSAIQKMETELSYLFKAGAEDTDLTDAFSTLRELVKSGHLDPKHERILAQRVYADPLVPEIGNKFAYNDFNSRPVPGVHVMMDGNDFKHVNDTFGHPVGDDVIKAIGKAIHESRNEVAPGHSKAWRFGGDEFAVHLPDHETAARFTRTVRAKLDAVPCVGGTHKVSLSFGLGHNPETADRALYAAKRQKFTPETAHLPEAERVRAFKVGQAPSFAHSLVPGQEGAIPLDLSQLNVKAVPPPPAKEL